MKPKHYTIPIFIPELACPFQCVYCNQKKISGQQEVPSEKEIIKSIEDHLSTIDYRNNEVELGFFGGNFTGIPMEEQEKYLKLVQPYIRQGKIKNIRLSTRPDNINQEILYLLLLNQVETIELGAQSMDDEVLKASRRGHSSEDTVKAAKLIQNNGFRLGIQMMIGLPGDSFEKTLYTAGKIADMEADDARIYPCLVIKGTKLEDWYHKGKYDALSLEEAVIQTKEVVKIFENDEVNIIRIGLHPSEGLCSGEELIAGPYHPSFRELVLTEFWNDLFQPLYRKHYRRRIKIHVPGSELNVAIGHQSKNKKALMEFYDEVQILPDEKIMGRTFYVDYY